MKLKERFIQFAIESVLAKWNIRVFYRDMEVINCDLLKIYWTNKLLYHGEIRISLTEIKK